MILFLKYHLLTLAYRVNSVYIVSGSPYLHMILISNALIANEIATLLDPREYLRMDQRVPSEGVQYVILKAMLQLHLSSQTAVILYAINSIRAISHSIPNPTCPAAELV